MTQQTPTATPDDVIDVVGDFHYNTCNEAYNQAFRQWRSAAKVPYAFRFFKRTKERIYVDGAGFLDISPAEVAGKTLSRLSFIIGVVLIVCLFCDVGASNVLVRILNRLHINISFTALDMSLYGSQWAIVGTRILICVLKYALPVLILQCAFHFPTQLWFPISRKDTVSSLAGPSLSILAALLVNEISDSMQISFFTQQTLYSYQNSASLLLYIAFDLLVGSMLIELLYRSMLLTALRQFGDRFAVLMIAFFALLMPNDLPCRVGECLIGLICGFCMLRSGSLLQCYFTRISYSIIIFGQVAITNNPMQNFNYSRFRLMALIIAGCGLLVAGISAHRHKRPDRQMNRVTVLAGNQKLSTFLYTTTMLPFLVIATLLTIIQLGS